MQGFLIVFTIVFCLLFIFFPYSKVKERVNNSVEDILKNKDINIEILLNKRKQDELNKKASEESSPQLDEDESEEDEGYSNDTDITKNNEKITQILEKRATRIKEKLTVFNVNNKYGVKYKEKIVIPAEYDYIEPYEYCFIVKKRSLVGCLSDTGKIIVPVEYQDIEFISKNNAFIVTYKDNQAGLYKYDGTKIFDTAFKTIKDYNHLEFVPTFLIESYNGKYSLVVINKNPVLIIEDADFIPDKYNDYIDKVITSLVINMNGASVSIANQKKGKWGIVTYLDYTGEILENSEYIYDNVSVYPDEDVKDLRDKPKFFFVQQNNKWGIIIPYPSKVVKDVQYDYVKNLTKQFYLVKTNEKYGLLDLDKMKETGLIFDDIKYEHGLNIQVKQNGQWQTKELFIDSPIFDKNIDY